MRAVGFCLFWLCTVALAAPADPAAPPAAPWSLPTFHGAPADAKPPGGVVEPPAALDARGLFDLVLTCYPTRSWWRPEVALQGRLTGQKQLVETDAAGNTQSGSGSYAALVLSVPLYSAADIDRERERERARRGDVAKSVGKLEQLLADRGVLRREMDLWKAIETRSSRRVVAGVAETAEQVAAISKLSDIEGKLRANRADLTAQTLELVGMCGDRRDVEAAIEKAIGR